MVYCQLGTVPGGFGHWLQWPKLYQGPHSHAARKRQSTSPKRWGWWKTPGKAVKTCVIVSGSSTEDGWNTHAKWQKKLEPIFPRSRTYVEFKGTGKASELLHLMNTTAKPLQFHFWTTFFAYQSGHTFDKPWTKMICMLVSKRFSFTDDHLLPYSDFCLANYPEHRKNFPVSFMSSLTFRFFVQK